MVCIVNESTRETFDSDLCKKYKRHSLFIESNDEWKFIKKFITEASYEFIAEMKVNNSVSLNVLLDGVERFGKISPKMVYDKYLKDYQIHRDNSVPCKRYVIVAQWPELSEIKRRMEAMKFVNGKPPNGILSISVQSISCTELKNRIWHIICKRHKLLRQPEISLFMEEVLSIKKYGDIANVIWQKISGYPLLPSRAQKVYKILYKQK
uniref:Uncharacterized protein n=1 Tax=Wuchereria bancrofti TaxID=6293 RepID=A0A1I8ENT7_WUCBA